MLFAVVCFLVVFTIDGGAVGCLICLCKYRPLFCWVFYLVAFGFAWFVVCYSG